MIEKLEPVVYSETFIHALNRIVDKVNELVDVVNRLEAAHPKIFDEGLKAHRERNPFYRNDPELER